jgi:thioredoxin 1
VLRRETSCSYVVILLLVSAVGCKADGDRVAMSEYDALLDETTFEDPVTYDQAVIAKNPATHDDNSITLTSLHKRTPPVKTLGPNESLGELVGGASGVVLLDFYADWCGPCRKQSKVLHDIVSSGVDAQIIKVNVDEHRKLAKEYRVSSLPTLLVLEDGEVRQSKVGYTERDELENMLR